MGRSRFWTEFDDLFDAAFNRHPLFTTLMTDETRYKTSKGETVTYSNGWLVHKIDNKGDVFTYANGVLHSIEGPAIIRKDGKKEYYIEGREVSEEEHKRYVKKLNDEKTYRYVIEITNEEKEKIEKLLGRKIE